MRVLVLGGGGREHALCWALRRDPQVTAVLCAPGNAGIAEVAELLEVDPCDGEAVVAAARREAVDLVVVGPEAPLVAGVVDALAAAGVAAFGPSAAAARLEASKAFAKQVMASAGVPTAAHWSGSNPSQARRALDGFSPPYVVKADGLAAGKGVVICATRAEAEVAIDAALLDGRFGEAGASLVIEAFLHGPEVSVFGLCDGTDALLLAPAQDFKRAREGGAGANTGGMGAYCPYPLEPAVTERLGDTVFRPVLTEMARRGTPFVGVLYAGLVLTDDGPRVLEFNARFGDPETQVVLPRLRSGLGGVLAACAGGELAGLAPLEWDRRACVTVVLASGGYPGRYSTGEPISGLAEAAANPDTLVFHAGTRREGGRVVTAGGRVLAVTGFGETVPAARRAAYRSADVVSFDNLHRRDDIAAEVRG